MDKILKSILKAISCFFITGILIGWLWPDKLFCQESFPRDPGPCYGTGGCEPYVSPATWTGNANNNWYNPVNWSDGTIPGPGNDVLAPSGTATSPRITGGRVTVKSLTIAPGSKLEIDPYGAMTVTENTINRGQIVIYSSRLSAASNSSGSLITQGRILCDGTAGHEESFTEAWHYFGMPVTSGHANGCYGPCWIKYWDEPTASWIYFTDSSQQINVMKGYAIWSDGQYKFHGKDFNWGTMGPIVLTGHYNYPGNTWDGWNLVGNSYPSCINWGTDNKPVNGWTRTNLDKSIYTWTGYAAQYAYFNGAGDGDSLNGGSRFVFSTQGFFVHVTEPNTTGEIGMEEEVRAHCNGPVSKSSGTAKTTLRVKASGNEFSDELLIRFNEKAKTGIDDYDTYKLFGEDIAPQIYSLSDNNQKLAMNTYPEILKQMSVPICFTTGKSGVYTLLFTQLNSFPSAVTISLKDLKENVTTPLIADYTYSFNYIKEDDSCRFRILFENASYGMNNIEDDYDIQVYSYDQDIFIKNSAQCSGFVFIYDLLGHSVYSGILKNIPVTKITPDVSCGYYIVKVITNKKVHNQKVYLN